MKWCNYQAENELADFADLLYRAIVAVQKGNNRKEFDFEFRYEFDNATPVISFERGGIGPFENISFGYSLKFKDLSSSDEVKTGKKQNYFRIGKIILASGAHNIYIWFPVTKDHPKNKDWYDRIKEKYKKYNYTTSFTYGAAPDDNVWIGMSHLYRSAFFGDSADGLVSMSKQELLETFFTEVLTV
jgi:hypothetical protein